MTSEGIAVDGENAVTRWFGEDFGRLHPLLQTLHRHDGTLRGPVILWFAHGRAGAMGRRLHGISASRMLLVNIISKSK